MVSSPISGHILHITRLLTAVGGGKVVCVEKDALVALDLKTGRELWRTPRPASCPPNAAILRENLLNFSTLVMHQDVVLFLQTEESYDLARDREPGRAVPAVRARRRHGQDALDAAVQQVGTGVEGDVFVIDDLAWTHDADELAVIGIDLHSGEIKRTISTEDAFDEVHHHRCFRNKATERYLLTGRRGIETIDLQQEQTTKNEWVRGACRYGIMPCNGLIYVPPHPCQCYIDVKLNGFYALAAANEVGAQGRRRKAASGAGGPGASNGRTPPRSEARRTAECIESALPTVPRPLGDWPTYRHDIRRSGSTTAEVPAELTQLWEAGLAAASAPARSPADASSRRRSTEHRVVALDADDGSSSGTSPPADESTRRRPSTSGLVLFGSADGWVYCLRRRDGRWRGGSGRLPRRATHRGLRAAGIALARPRDRAGQRRRRLRGRRPFDPPGRRHPGLCLQPETGELIRELQPLNERAARPGGRAGRRRRSGLRAASGVLPEIGRPASPRHGLGEPTRPPACWTIPVSPASAGRPAASIGKNGKVRPSAKAADLLVVRRALDLSPSEANAQGGFGGWFQAGTGAYELAGPRTGNPGKPRWTSEIPVRVRALAAAGQTILAAGPRDVVDPKIRGHRCGRPPYGSVLWVLEAADGSKLAEYSTGRSPAWDGSGDWKRQAASCRRSTAR